jgi:hypothetical protein
MVNPFAPPADDGSGHRPEGSDGGHAASSSNVQTADPVDYVVCEVCRLPHRRDAVICEDCGHLLGRAPDWSSIRGKRASHARQFALALVVVVGMLWLNVLAFGAAGFLIWMAPVFWLFMSGYRYRALSKSLKRSSVRAPALDPGTR